MQNYKGGSGAMRMGKEKVNQELIVYEIRLKMNIRMQEPVPRRQENNERCGNARI